MRVDGGSRGGASDQGDGQSGGMKAPGGGGSANPQREEAGKLGSRTDRGNQNDEGIGSSASRGGGGGEASAPNRRGAADLDPTLHTADHFGTGGVAADNPDVTGTTDELEG
jgi:hypothetical protein